MIAAALHPGERCTTSYVVSIPTQRSPDDPSPPAMRSLPLGGLDATVEATGIGYARASSQLTR